MGGKGRVRGNGRNAQPDDPGPQGPRQSPAPRAAIPPAPDNVVPATNRRTAPDAPPSQQPEGRPPAPPAPGADQRGNDEDEESADTSVTPFSPESVHTSRREGQHAARLLTKSPEQLLDLDKSGVSFNFDSSLSCKDFYFYLFMSRW